MIVLLSPAHRRTHCGRLLLLSSFKWSRYHQRHQQHHHHINNFYSPEIIAPQLISLGKLTTIPYEKQAVTSLSMASAILCRKVQLTVMMTRFLINIFYNVKSRKNSCSCMPLMTISCILPTMHGIDVMPWSSLQRSKQRKIVSSVLLEQ